MSATVVCNELALRHLDEWLATEGVDARELDELACEQFFDDQLDRYAISTVRHRLSTIRAAYQYGIRHGLAARDPTGDVVLPNEADKEPATYSNDELRAIHAAIRDSREERLFCLYAYTGARQAEAAGLRWDQIDLANRQIRLVGKAGKLRVIPIHSALELLLNEHDRPGRGDYLISKRTGEAMSVSWWHATARTLVDRAGVPSRAPSHTFRKTVATVLYEQGVRGHVIDQILGWAPSNVRNRHYVRIAAPVLHDAISTLYCDDPITPNIDPGHRPIALVPPCPPPNLRDDLNRLIRLEQLLGLQTSPPSCPVPPPTLVAPFGPDPDH